MNTPKSLSTQNVLQQVAREHPPTGFSDAKEFLKVLHLQAKAKLKRYSYRQLSEDLGFSHTNVVHLFVQGKRPISLHAADRIAERLELSQLQRNYLQAIVKSRYGKDVAEREIGLEESIRIKGMALSRRIDKDQLSYYSDYHHPIIREMVAMEHFSDDPKWIAAKVFPKITTKQAEESLRLLRDLGMIYFDSDRGRYVQSDPHLSTGPEILSLSIRNYHKEAIPKGVEALALLPANERHISALTLRVDQVKLAKIKTEIEAFQQRLIEIEKDSSNTGKEQVMQLNMQLFPGSRENEP